jgi:hypothetical protein
MQFIYVLFLILLSISNAFSSYKLFSIPGNGAVYLIWFYQDGQVSPNVGIQYQKSKNERWEAINQQPIPLSIESGKTLDHLAKKDKADAELAFRNAVDAGRIRPGPYGELEKTQKDTLGGVIYSLLTISHFDLALYTGSAFVDNRAIKGGSYRLLDSKNTVLDSSEVNPVIGGIRGLTLRYSHDMDQLELEWHCPVNKEFPPQFLKFTVSDELNGGAVVVDGKSCFDQDSLLFCQFSLGKSALQHLKREAKLKISESVLGKVDVFSSVVKIQFPMLKSELPSLPLLTVDPICDSVIPWKSTDFFGDSLRVDSTKISAYSWASGVATVSQTLKGRVNTGVLDLIGKMRGETINVDVIYYTPIREWRSATVNAKVRPLYDAEGRMTWNPKISTTLVNNRPVLELLLDSVPLDLKCKQRSLFVSDSIQIQYDIKNKNYLKNRILIPISSDSNSGSIQVCETRDRKKYCSDYQYELISKDNVELFYRRFLLGRCVKNCSYSWALDSTLNAWVDSVFVYVQDSNRWFQTKTLFASGRIGFKRNAKTADSVIIAVRFKYGRLDSVLFDQLRPAIGMVDLDCPLVHRHWFHENEKSGVIRDWSWKNEDQYANLFWSDLPSQNPFMGNPVKLEFKKVSPFKLDTVGTDTIIWERPWYKKGRFIRFASLTGVLENRITLKGETCVDSLYAPRDSLPAIQLEAIQKNGNLLQVTSKVELGWENEVDSTFVNIRTAKMDSLHFAFAGIQTSISLTQKTPRDALLVKTGLLHRYTREVRWSSEKTYFSR